MQRKKSPQEKKNLDCKKQHRGFSEYAHSLRHGKWRKKKRRPAQKSERQAERLAVSTRAGETLTDSGFDPGPIVPLDRQGAPHTFRRVDREEESGSAGARRREETPTDSIPRRD